MKAIQPAAYNYNYRLSYSWRKVIINLFTLLGISLWSENYVILSGLVPARVRTHLSPLEVLHCQKIPLFFLDWCRRIPYTFVTTWSVPLSENSVILSGLVPARVRAHLSPLKALHCQKIPLFFLDWCPQDSVHICHHLKCSVVRKFRYSFWTGASRCPYTFATTWSIRCQKIPWSFLGWGQQENKFTTNWSVQLSENSVILSGPRLVWVWVHLPPLAMSEMNVGIFLSGCRQKSVHNCHRPLEVFCCQIFCYPFWAGDGIKSHLPSLLHFFVHFFQHPILVEVNLTHSVEMNNPKSWKV